MRLSGCGWWSAMTTTRAGSSGGQRLDPDAGEVWPWRVWLTDAVFAIAHYGYSFICQTVRALLRRE